MRPDLRRKASDVEGLPFDLVIHPSAGLRQIRKTDAEFEQRDKLVRLISSRRDPGLVQRAPEAVAGMRVVVPEFGGTRARGGADEDDAKAGAKLVGEAVQLLSHG